MDNKELSELLGRVIASLTDEQKEKVKGCETVDQLMAKLSEMGVELPDELLDQVGGGFGLSIGTMAYTGPFGHISLANLFDQFPFFNMENMDLLGQNGWEATHMDWKGSQGKGTVRFV